MCLQEKITIVPFSVSSCPFSPPSSDMAIVELCLDTAFPLSVLLARDEDLGGNRFVPSFSRSSRCRCQAFQM